MTATRTPMATKPQASRERVRRSGFREAVNSLEFMTEVEITEDTLTVHVLGWDRPWALKSRIEVPLAHVASAKVDPEIARREWWKGIKAPGTELPGVIKAGTFYQWREHVFWDVHDPDKTIVIELGDERYARLVIEVEAPPTTVAAIKQALGGLRG